MPGPVAELLAELVGIDSVNPGLVPGAAGETRIVEHLSSRLSAAGFATHVVGPADRPSLVAVPPVEGRRRLLDPRWQAEAELLTARDGWRLDDAGTATELAARLGAALGTGPTFDAPYWMEAPLWQSVCPTLVCGPGGGGLHAVDEWVDLTQVRRYAEALVEVLGAD